MLLFSTQSYDRDSFTRHNHSIEPLYFLESSLSLSTAALAQGHEVVCAFINDDLSAPVLEQLAQGGTRLIVLRSAGYNHVDLTAAQRLGLAVARVPAYSPHAIAEHSLALILALNRRIHRAYNRTREGDFSLHGLIGFDLHGKTVGIIGAGKIGAVLARIMLGLGCKVLAFDPQIDAELSTQGVRFTDLDELLNHSDIVSLHCPLNSQTHHLINAHRLAQLKPGAMLINTGRGALIDTPALIKVLKSGHLGYLGLDVYEEEADLFFQDGSDQPLQDDVLARLLTFPNVIVTAHQAFLTQEALACIAQTTLANLAAWRAGRAENLLTQ